MYNCWSQCRRLQSIHYFDINYVFNSIVSKTAFTRRDITELCNCIRNYIYGVQSLSEKAENCYFEEPDNSIANVNENRNSTKAHFVNFSNLIYPKINCV